MNELNYASLEASQRLVAAGIVLKTDSKWAEYDLKLGLFELCPAYRYYFEGKEFPAPSMSELWRELPKAAWMIKGQFQGGTTAIYNDSHKYSNENPCDALADLLIWVRGRE